MEKVNLPSFLFVGTAKAGTTSVYNYLLQHPEIKIPKKETFFFLNELYKNNKLEYPKQRKRSEYILDQKEYQDLYKGIKGCAGEIGTGYLYHHKQAIPLIKNYLGKEVKILIILRNPIERAFSSFMHFVKDTHETSSFLEALSQEPYRKKMAWDFMWQHKDMGLYSSQVKAYFDAFEHVKVLFYEELKKDPKFIMKEITNFIGLDSSFEFDTQISFNASGAPKSKSLQQLITTENSIKKFFRPIFRILFSEQKREAIRKGVKNKNIGAKVFMDPSERNKLIQFYKEDISKLEALISKDLSSLWK